MQAFYRVGLLASRPSPGVPGTVLCLVSTHNDMTGLVKPAGTDQSVLPRYALRVMETLKPDHHDKVPVHKWRNLHLLAPKFDLNLSERKS